MQKAERARVRFQGSRPPSEDAARSSTHMQVNEAKPNRPPESPDGGAAPARRAPPDSWQETITNRTSDVLSLISEAKEKEIPATVLQKFYREVGSGLMTMGELNQMERQLRHWIVNGYSPSAAAKPEPSHPASPVNTASQ